MITSYTQTWTWEFPVFEGHVENLDDIENLAGPATDTTLMKVDAEVTDCYYSGQSCKFIGAWVNGTDISSIIDETTKDQLAREVVRLVEENWNPADDF